MLRWDTQTGSALTAARVWLSCAWLSPPPAVFRPQRSVACSHFPSTRPPLATPHVLSKKKRKKGKSLSRVRLFETPWTVAHQAPPSMGFSRQEYWSGLPFPSPGDLPAPGSDPGLPHRGQTLCCLSHSGSPVSTTRTQMTPSSVAAPCCSRRGWRKAAPHLPWPSDSCPRAPGRRSQPPARRACCSSRPPIAFPSSRLSLPLSPEAPVPILRCCC